MRKENKMDNMGFYVAKAWHEILMNSSTEEDVEKYSELMKHSPVEIQIIIMTGTSKNLLLRDYISALHIPKSTLTSTVNRLEKQQMIKRVISQTDKRSYGLELDMKGMNFLNKYISYQSDIGAKIISGLDKTEQQQLISLLEKISSYMIKG